MSAHSQSKNHVWNLPAKGDRYIDIRISRNTLIASIVSLIIHAILLFAFFPRTPLLPPPSEPQNIVVELAKKPAPKPAPPPPVTQAEPKPQPKAPMVKTPKIMAVEKPQAQIRQQPLPTPAPKQDTTQQAPTDMMSYINAQRAKRQSQEDYASQQNAAAVASERQTEDERRDAIIKRNLSSRGNGGVFNVSSKTSRSAIVSFNGWHGEFSVSRRETYEVFPGPDGDINLAIVRKVIARIRQENSGDFPWESQRLGRTVTLSARQEDNAGLEDFLMKEFFSDRGRSFNNY